MKYLNYIFLFLSCLCSCSPDIKIEGEIGSLPEIYPDYIDVTVPCNIAPLNFHIEGEGPLAAIFRSGDTEYSIKSKDGDIVVPEKIWRKMTQPTDQIDVTVCKKISGIWQSFLPFHIYVSRDSIDPYLVYRRIPPLYGTWREIGIYQRCLESYDESPIYKNVSYHGNCVNCHSFAARDAQNMLFHLRGAGAGTYMMCHGEKKRLDTKTDSTISNFTYPYWHPSGDFVAFSVNDIFQIFHSSDPNRTEVIDDDSDIIIYDIRRNEAFSCPQLKAQDALETFPAFSADGKKLYFCSATKPDSLPEGYNKLKYSICSIDFDRESRQMGSSTDTIFDAGNTVCAGPCGSMSVPRPSPDGRWIVTTLSPYGQFKIWHKDADLWIYDIESRQWRELAKSNSKDADSYHSWSSNSRWLVFSSRRDDGLYSRPYITHIDSAGMETKAFILPQRHPKKFYEDLKDSYNVPELINGPVDLDSRKIVNWIEEPSQKVHFRP